MNVREMMTVSACFVCVKSRSVAGEEEHRLRVSKSSMQRTAVGSNEGNNSAGESHIRLNYID
jgi:hypothetical protein